MSSKIITSSAARLALQQLADDIAPTTLAEMGKQLEEDGYDSPEAFVKAYKRPLSWSTKVKNVLIANGLTTEAKFFHYFRLSASRQRPCIVLPPAGPGVVDNTTTINNHPNIQEEITQ